MSENLYTHSHKRAKTYLLIKTMGIYIGLFVLWLFTVSLYSTFGERWIYFAVVIIWTAGAIGVRYIPEDQENIVKETKWAVFGYLAFLLVYRIVIVQFSSLSPDEVGSSLGVNVPVASAASALGFLQNLLMIISIMVPIGYAIWIGQKFKVHQGGKRKDEAFTKYKGLRKNDAQNR